MSRPVPPMAAATLLLCAFCMLCFTSLLQTTQARTEVDVDVADEFTIPAFSNEDRTVHLSAANFSEIVSGNAYTLVEFYAPWCGHCKHFAPEYRLASYELAKAGADDTMLAMMDCVANEAFCQKVGIKQFPTLVLFRLDHPKPIEYTGELNAKSVVNYLQKQQGLTHVVVRDQQHLRSIMRRDTAIILFCEENSPEQQVFIEVAKKWSHLFYMAISHNREQATAISAAFPSLHVYMLDYQETHHAVYDIIRDGAFTEENINNWLRIDAFPRFAFITPKNWPFFRQRRMARVWFFVDLSRLGNLPVLGTALGEHFRGRLSIVYADWEAHKDFAISMKVPPVDTILPAIVLEDGDIERTWVYDDSSAMVNLENLVNWLEGILAFKVKCTVRSEPVPTLEEDTQRQKAGNRLRGTQKLVGLNMEEQLFEQNTTSYIVMFGSKPCAQCKLFNPTFRNVAAKITDEQTADAQSGKKTGTYEYPLKFAHFDMQHNSLRAQPLPLPEGLPYILFVPAQGDLKYNGTIMYRGGERAENIFEEWVRNVRAGGDGGQKHLEPNPEEYQKRLEAVGAIKPGTKRISEDAPAAATEQQTQQASSSPESGSVAQEKCSADSSTAQSTCSSL